MKSFCFNIFYIIFSTEILKKIGNHFSILYNTAFGYILPHAILLFIVTVWPQASARQRLSSLICLWSSVEGVKMSNKYFVWQQSFGVRNFQSLVYFQNVLHSPTSHWMPKQNLYPQVQTLVWSYRDPQLAGTIGLSMRIFLNAVG